MTKIIAALSIPDFRIIETLATTIWTEHYTPIIGKEQVDYMLNKFQSIDAIKNQLEEGGEYFIIKHKEIPVGYLSYYNREETLFLSKIYVLSTSRGKGIGKAAMSFIQSNAIKMSCPSISLTVNKYNTASIKAYEKMGFKKIEELIIDIGNGFIMDDFKMEKLI